MPTIAIEPITRERAAEILEVSIRTIDNYVRDSQIPMPVRLGGGRRLYWHPEIFYNWLDWALRGDGNNDLSSNVPGLSKMGPEAPGQIIAAGSPRSEPRQSNAKVVTKRKVTGRSAMDDAANRSDELLRKLQAGAATK